ncbi:MAG: TIGR00375 family protein [Candidatus Thermoplasmatota archaeon]
MIVNSDLHIHSRYSGGTSDDMRIAVLAREAKRKGIQLVGTGDCLHPKWLKEIMETEKIDDGTFELDGTRFVLTTEVEDNRRVHHLLIFPSVSSIEEFKKNVGKRSQSFATDGRPKMYMNGEEIANLVNDVDGLIGPCHAFTPWTGIYSAYDSISDSYGSALPYISYIELGLSADSSYADRIAELSDILFLTNSDAHSPLLIRFAREFNRFEMDKITFDGLKKAILEKKILLNVGFPPEEGKYNESACINCFKHFKLIEAKERNWKCSCGGRIKKGVKDRVEELANYPLPKHPKHRPPYLHIIPLGEIIGKAIGASPTSKKVEEEWCALVGFYGNEANVLVDADIDKIIEISGDKIGWAIEVFRENRIIVHPGGGGEYGRIELPAVPEKKKKGQLCLSDF